MLVALQVTIVKDNTSELLQGLMNQMKPQQMVRVNRDAARQMLSEVRDYYRVFSANGGWLNPLSSTHTDGPGSRKNTRFGAQVVKQWYEYRVDRQGFVLKNDSFLAQKINPQRISAIRGRWLTIPLIKRAHGRSTKEYRAKFGPLFMIKTGRNQRFLAEAFGPKDKSGGSQVRFAYALKQSIRLQRPTRGAKVPNSVFQRWVREVTTQMNFSILKAARKSQKS